MAIYTVHEPPLKHREARRGPEGFAFLRDGFHFWAFLLTPLWLVWHRLWLGFVIFVLMTAVVQVSLTFLGASEGARFLAYVLIAILVGLEAGTLRRRKLQWKGWREAGTVQGGDLETAEHRFFDSWSPPEPQAAPIVRAAPPPITRSPPPRSDIVGLFPEPGAPR